MRLCQCTDAPRKFAPVTQWRGISRAPLEHPHTNPHFAYIPATASRLSPRAQALGFPLPFAGEVVWSEARNRRGEPSGNPPPPHSLGTPRLQGRKVFSKKRDSVEARSLSCVTPRAKKSAKRRCSREATADRVTRSSVVPARSPVPALSAAAGPAAPAGRTAS